MPDINQDSKDLVSTANEPTKHDLFGISKSALDLVHRSPAHYHDRYILGNKKPATKALDEGKAIDTLTLEPEKFDDQFIVIPQEIKSSLKKEAKAYKQRAEVWAKHTRKTVIDENTYMMAKGCAEAVRSHPIVNMIMSDPNGRAQYKIVWTDPETGIKMQGYLDYITGAGIAFDLKSTTDARKSEFERSVGKYRYDVQAALYIDGCAALGIRIEHFYFVAVEKERPHCVAVYALTQDDIQAGRTWYKHDLFVYQACKRSGKWPGYQNKINELNVPPWALKQREMRTGE